MTTTVRVKHLGSYRTDFHDNLYFNIFGKKLWKEIKRH